MKEVSNKKNSILKKESMLLVFMLGEYFLLVLLLNTLSFILNLKNNFTLIQIISIVLPVIKYLLGTNKRNIKPVLLTITVYLSLLLLLPYLSSKTYDLTYDGNSYHKTAIAFLKNGWNPLYESSITFQNENKNIVKFDEDGRVDLWIEHYPKATWIIAATIYNMTGNIESGKCITIIFLIMLFIITINCLRIIIDKKWAILITTLLILNPISLAQIFSYYVDGIMFSMFVMELLLLFLINPKEKINKNIWLLLISIITIFTNLKFTGLLSSGIIACIFYIYWLISTRGDKNYKDIVKRVTILFTVIFIIAIICVGSTSYLKNTIDHKNPLYPLIGKDKVDIITTMQPQEFKDKNMLEKFTISLFSRTENILNDGRKPMLKLPIKVYKSEIGELFAPDVRIGGFGPLFALAFIASLIGICYLIVTLIKEKNLKLKYIIIPTFAILLSSILLGENWWARYVPQLYLFPLGTILLSLYLYSNKKRKSLLLVSIIVTVPLILNTCCFLYVNLKSIANFKEIESDLSTMKKTKNLTLRLAGDGKLYGYYYSLKDRNIEYTIDESLKSTKLMYKDRFEVK